MTIAKLLQSDVDCVAGKRERFDWTIRLEDANGERCGLGESDAVIFRLAATADGTAQLEVSSADPTDNDSAINIVSLGSTTTDASGTLTLQADDTEAFSNTLKHYELNVADAGDSNRETQPIRGKMKFLPSIGAGT